MSATFLVVSGSGRLSRPGRVGFCRGTCVTIACNRDRVWSATAVKGLSTGGDLWCSNLQLAAVVVGMLEMIGSLDMGVSWCCLWYVRISRLNSWKR